MRTFGYRIFTFILVLILLISLSACNENIRLKNTSDDVSSADLSDNSCLLSEDSQNVSSAESAQKDYYDSVFKKTTYIKCSDASNEKNYESIYRFDIEGQITYSKNIYSGFEQENAEYYTRTYKDTGLCEIWYYVGKNKDAAEILFSINNDDEINEVSSAPASFINEDEFNDIYNFHTEWNRKALGGFDE